MIKTTAYDQGQILRDIITLYCPDGFHCDPTYSTGGFYKDTGVPVPPLRFDLFPQCHGVREATAERLPIPNAWLRSMVFDPPFLVGHTKDKPTGIMGERFHGLKYISDLWSWYSACIIEHYRVLRSGGVYVMKCQDTVSSGKQHLSHIHVVNEMQSAGFYVKDLFILLAKNRMIGHNHTMQKHARKFHSYFIVAVKK